MAVSVYDVFLPASPLTKKDEKGKIMHRRPCNAAKQTRRVLQLMIHFSSSGILDSSTEPPRTSRPGRGLAPKNWTIEFDSAPGRRIYRPPGRGAREVG